MLDDCYLPSHVRLSHVLLDQNYSQEDKIQHLVDLGLLNLEYRTDQLIFNRLTSKQYGSEMLAFISFQLKHAQGFLDRPVEIIFPGKNPGSQPAESLDEVHRRPHAINRHVIQQFRNEIRGPNGEQFVQIYSAGGNLTRYSRDFYQGRTSTVFFLHAVSLNGEKEVVAIKVPIVDDTRGNDAVVHEYNVLKNLGHIKNVVKLWGPGLFDVRGHKVLALRYVPHSVTDKRALTTLNINDLRAITSQVLSIMSQASKMILSLNFFFTVQLNITSPPVAGARG